MAWRVRNLGDVCIRIQDGAHHSPKRLFRERGEGQFLYITSKNIRNNFIDVSTASYVDGDFHNQIYSRCRPELGDVLLTKDGANTGNVTLNTIDEPFSLLSSVCLIKTRPEQLSPAFLKYYIQSPNGLNQIISQMTGAAIKRIILKDIKTATIPLPSLSEQQRIVGILDEAFEGIATAKANAEKNLQSARALFDSYRDAVFREERDGWAHTLLGKICDRVSVGHVGITSPYYRPDGVLFLRTQNLTKAGLQLENVKYITQDFHASLRKSQIQGGDVLMSRVITNVVNCAIVPEGLGPANCANVVLVRPGPKLFPQYLVHYIRSREAQTHLLGRRVGSAQLVVNTTVVKTWPIRIPTVARQQRIVAKLNELSSNVQQLESIYEQKIAAFGELKKSLLHQAFSGRL